MIKLSDNPGKPGFGQFIVTYVSSHSGGNIHKYRFPPERVPVCKPVFFGGGFFISLPDMLRASFGSAVWLNELFSGLTAVEAALPGGKRDDCNF